MLSKSYRLKQLARRRAASRAGNSARERKRIAEATQWVDVGGFATNGILGSHHVRLLARDGERVLAIVVDGQHRRPRTIRGILRVLSEMIHGRM